MSTVVTRLTQACASAPLTSNWPSEVVVHAPAAVASAS